MPRGHWLLALAALLAGCGPRHTDADARPDPNDSRRPFLWRVDAPGAGPSYLLGTFHLGVAPAEVLPPSVFAKLDGARVVVLEVDIAVPEALGIERQPPGRTLEQDMTPEQWTRLVAAMKLDADGAAKLQEIKMWALVTTMVQGLLPETETIDGAVQDRARGADKPLVFLEDIRTQAKLLEKYMTVDLMLALLADQEGKKQELLAQADAYKSGDELRMFNESLSPAVMTNAQQREDVVFARNRRWLPGVERGCAPAARSSRSAART
jgi:uncharacterized protein YbaP (TraB family)